MDVTLINVSQYPANGLEPEERDFWGVMDLQIDAPDLPLSHNSALDMINGRTFYAVWPDEDFHW